MSFIKKQQTERETEEEENQVKMEAETGVMLPKKRNALGKEGLQNI